MNELFNGYSQFVKEDNKIYYNSYNGKQFVGYTPEAYEELQQLATEATNKAEKYYKMLVDNKIIIPNKTQEEINGELLSAISSITDTLKELKSSVKELKNGYTKSDKTKTKSKSENAIISETSV